MPTSTHLDDLKINVLTESQFDAAVQGGVIGAGEISMITDLDEAIQVDTLPTAAATELGKIYQFTGTTGTYTHGYFYECVSDGQPTPTYSWSQVNVQPTPSGLPSQSGNSGKFLTTDGTDASWATINALQNTATASSSLTLLGTANTSYQEAVNIGSISKVTAAYGVAIGRGAEANGQYATAIGGWSPKAGGASSIAIGDPAQATDSESIAIGSNAKAQSYKSIAIGSGAVVGNWKNYAIQLGGGTNSEAGTLYIGSYYNNSSVNYKLLDADGTIPKERLANVVTTPSTAPVLAVADWSSNTQTITVTGVTATNTVFVAPAPASAADYAAAGILCTAQAANSLTFTCTTVPSNAITLSVVILG